MAVRLRRCKALVLRRCGRGVAPAHTPPHLRALPVSQCELANCAKCTRVGAFAPRKSKCTQCIKGYKLVDKKGQPGGAGTAISRWCPWQCQLGAATICRYL